MMTDYIRRQDAFDAVDARIAELMTHPEFRRKHFDIDLSGIIRNISAIKPADVAPVVRCKDCENWQTDWNPSIPDRHYCAVMDSIMKVDDFCSYGERREE